MRGADTTEMNVLKHRPKAIELALVKAGYALSDIRGERAVHQYRERPRGLAATVGRVSPRSALLAATGTLALGLFLAYETGMVSPVAASLALAAALYLLGQVDADPVAVEHEVTRRGMTHREVQERLIQAQEWKRIKKERQEREAKKANAASGGH